MTSRFEKSSMQNFSDLFYFSSVANVRRIREYKVNWQKLRPDKNSENAVKAGKYIFPIIYQY